MRKDAATNLHGRESHRKFSRKNSKENLHSVDMSSKRRTQKTMK
jgi:hypothetical protein